MVVVGLMARSLVTFRGELLRALAARGHEVLAVAPEDDAEVAETLRRMGVRYRVAPIARNGLDPATDLATLRALRRIFRAFRADVVLVYGAKPVVYGAIAARLAGVPLRVAMVTGAGSMLAPQVGVRQRLVGGLVRALYAVGLRQVHLVLFQNADDRARFRQLHLLPARTRTVLINGSGVDLDAFAWAPTPEPPLRFLLVGRLLRDKGLREYADAARCLRSEHPAARFRLLGPFDTNPTALPTGTVEHWHAEGVIDYLGATDDVRPHLAAAHVLVLPSYGEGMPRSVLEAMAMGRPIITTDVPGCRETVVEGRNGFLVPVRDAQALARAMRRFIEDPSLVAPMGVESRRMAEERFDVHAVNRVILDAIGAA